MSFPNFPPRVPNFLPQVQRPTVLPFPVPGQKFGFFSPTTRHMMPAMIPQMIRKETPQPNTSAPQTVSVSSAAPTIGNSAPPATTVFVGNMTEKSTDDLIQKILKECGNISNWKRLQDSNGKFKAFGFCEYEHPQGTLNALKILNGYLLGEKRLTVKTDENTTKMLDEFTKAKKAEKNESEEGKEDQNSEEKITEKIRLLIESTDPNLLKMTEESKEATVTRSSASKTTTDNDSKTRKRHSSRSSSTSHHRQKSSGPTLDKISPEEKPKRSRHSSRSRSTSSSSSDSSSSRTTISGREKRITERTNRDSNKHSKSRRKSSTDSEDSYIKRRLQKEIKDKEESYQKILQKWEERERRLSKQYAKDEEAALELKKMLNREAKKLKQFLEDYEDERDDPKFYKGSSLSQRRRNYEHEKNSDSKDRHDEHKEIEELKKVIMENKKLPDTSEDSGDSDQECLTWDQKSDEEGSKDSIDVRKKKLGGKRQQGNSGSGTWSAVEPGGITIPNGSSHRQEQSQNSATESPILTPKKGGGKLVTTLNKPSSTSSLSVIPVFGEDEEEEDTIHQIKKKIKPFEITQEDRMKHMTPEERKKLIKDLIDRIPTNKEKLFMYVISWKLVDSQLIEQRIKPWINKKISEYIGEEELSLVSFICEKITGHVEPGKILQDLSMVLDEEAEVFMVKLWRLIIYESEAKKLGISSNPGA